MIGLAVAVANVDQIIEIIKSSKDPNEARTSLLKTKWLSKDIDDLLKLVDDPRQIKNEKEIYLTDEQAKAILELRLQRLTALGKDEIKSELSDLSNQINKFLSILRDTEVLNDVINVELNEIKKQFAIPRRTEINEGEATDIDQEDLVQRSDMVVSVTNSGYIKRVPLNMYRAQKRGGKGRAGMKTNEEDFVTQVFTSSTHDNICLLYTSPSPRD